MPQTPSEWWVTKIDACLEPKGMSIFGMQHSLGVTLHFSNVCTNASFNSETYHTLTFSRATFRVSSTSQ
jgi:hypothetical protein